MKVKHLVVDSGGFIRSAPIRDISENVYTLTDVVSEIKDKATKERLQVLPYELRLLEPSTEDIKLVTEFSKRTGDYPSLSATDLRVLALTVHLHSQYGVTPLKSEASEPTRWKVENKFATERQQVVGFYNPSNITKCNDDDIKETNPEEKDCNEVFEDNSDNEEDSSWIGPETLSSALEKMGQLTLDEQDTPVGCLTTDFAMQNVLIQLGLPVISVNGFLVREAKTFVLRCHACFHVTTIMTKKFCPRCGNQTLKRVAVSIGEDGQRELHINFRRPINIKGTNRSLPMPKGGKHSTDPVLCEDQPCAQNRPKKSGSTINPLDPDYEVCSSPFAFHDVHSRAAQLRSQVKRRSRR